MQGSNQLPNIHGDVQHETSFASGSVASRNDFHNDSNGVRV
jgi:hypothetical protein